MKPVVLSLAAAVLLLICVANHRQKSCFDEQFTNTKPVCPESTSMAEVVTGEPATSESLSEPVNLSGKHVNFFLSF